MGQCPGNPLWCSSHQAQQSHYNSTEIIGGGCPMSQGLLKAQDHAIFTLVPSPGTQFSWSSVKSFGLPVLHWARGLVQVCPILEGYFSLIARPWSQMREGRMGRVPKDWGSQHHSQELPGPCSLPRRRGLISSPGGHSAEVTFPVGGGSGLCPFPVAQGAMCPLPAQPLRV